jgi:hypothetical protein
LKHFVAANRPLSSKGFMANAALNPEQIRTRWERQCAVIEAKIKKLARAGQSIERLNYYDAMFENKNSLSHVRGTLKKTGPLTARASASGSHAISRVGERASSHTQLIDPNSLRSV